MRRRRHCHLMIQAHACKRSSIWVLQCQGSGWHS